MSSPKKSLHTSLRRLQKRIQPATALPPVVMRQGTVLAVNTGPPHSVDITIGGDDVTIPAVRYFSGYSPTVNDTVWVFDRGEDMIVLGDLS